MQPQRMADGLVQQALAPQMDCGTDRNEPDLSDAAVRAADQRREQMTLPERRFPIGAHGLSLILKSLDLVVSVAIIVVVLYQSGLTLLGARVGEVLPYAAIPLLSLWVLRSVNAYDVNRRRRIAAHMSWVLLGVSLPLILLLGAYQVFPALSGLQWPIVAALASGLGVLAVHAHAVTFLRFMGRSGRLSETVVIVGATPNAARLIERNGETGELNIVGIFDDRLSRAPGTVSGAPVLGRLDDLLNWDRLPEIDRIVVTITSEARDRVRGLIDRLRVLPQRVVLLLDLEGFDPETESLAEIARSPAAYVSGGPQDTRRAISKRLSDIVFASLMLIAFSPVLLVLALAIKLESKGPVFFRQRRHGFNNQIIRVWKFRSMRDDPDAEERMSAQTVENDPRVTRIGRFIRAKSLDELPQLLNVLKGEMSIVGPRPHAVGMTAEEHSVQSIVGDYAHRHRVKPGITGWAQINGSRGPVHTRDLVRERVRLDMEYVNRSSFWFDLYIMIMTAPCLLGDSRNER